MSTRVGMVVPSACSFVPEGWLECNGQAVSRYEYAELFAAIGTNFGAGNGSTTFNVPDYTGRVPIGHGSGGAAGTSHSGVHGHSVGSSARPSHGGVGSTGTGSSSVQREIGSWPGTTTEHSHPIGMSGHPPHSHSALSGAQKVMPTLGFSFIIRAIDP